LIVLGDGEDAADASGSLHGTAYVKAACDVAGDLVVTV
jgi:hypothetical protein